MAFPPQAQQKAPPQSTAPANAEEDEMEDDMGVDDSENMTDSTAMGANGVEIPQIDGEALQMLLFDRVKQLTPEEMSILDDMIDPTTVPVLFNLFPELGILFDKGSKLQGMMGQEQAPAMETTQPQMPSQQQQPAQEEEEPNPLSNPNVSRGLTGY